MHDRGREDVLNVMKMNSGCGVAQQEMHLTNTKQEFSYLGLHGIIIEVGDEQHMVFR